jgi:hypothetical protein
MTTTDMTTISVRAATFRTVRRTALLNFGATAGPLFLALAACQLPLNPGLDLSRHAYSFLSIGPYGWIQVLNFIVTGGLYGAGAVGLGLSIRRARGARLAVISGLGLGAGLITAGVFKVDPSFGYPPGAPDGVPSAVSLPAILHGVGFGVALVCWMLLLAVLAIHLLVTGRPVLGVATALAALGVAAVPACGFAPPVIYLSVAYGFLTMTAIFLQLRQQAA